MRINENQSLDLFENQFQTYLRIMRIGENHRELVRISQFIQESIPVRIIEESENW